MSTILYIESRISSSLDCDGGIAATLTSAVVCTIHLMTPVCHW